MSKALLVIDMQNVTVGREHHEMFDYGSGLLDAVNYEISYNTDGITVYIRNMMKDTLINKLAPVKAFAGSYEAALCDGLKIVSDNIFDKFKGDAFTNPQLVEFLLGAGIDTVVLVGVDGAGCIAETAKGAIKHGFNVIIKKRAVGTMQQQKQDKLFDKLEKAGAVIR